MDGPPTMADNDPERPAGGAVVNVTQPTMPPLEDFIPYLRTIWNSRQLTNGGVFTQRLEQALCDHLGVAHVSLFASGTTALLVALQALGIKGDVITTPFSFVATANALLWRGLRPVFTDIDPVTLNLDPAKIEAAITAQTAAIMPVHCFGHPCAVDAIDPIARRHGLKVLYDAAHAFGVRWRDTSVLNHGDLSVMSFHATKVFNTFEGGAIVCHDADTKRRIDILRNFGISDELTVEFPGINGKLNEVSAAFGLLQLQHVAAAVRKNKAIDARYRRGLAEVKGLRCTPCVEGANHSYFPILVEAGYPMSRDQLHRRLNEQGVRARRYFYPLICDLPMYAEPGRSPLPTASDVANRILCLPIYPDLEPATVDRIIALVAHP